MEWECSKCGKPARVTNGSYHYKESGLDNVILKGIDIIHCDHCGNDDPMIKAVSKVHDTIAEAVISRRGKLSGKEIRFLRKYMNISARAMAEILHVHPSTMSKWENDEDPIGDQSEALLRVLVAAQKNESYGEMIEHVKAVSSAVNECDILVDEAEYEYA